MSDLVGVWLHASEPLRFVPPASDGRPIVVQDPETGKWANGFEHTSSVAGYRLMITDIQGELCSFNSQIKRTATSGWEPRSMGVCVPLDHMLDEIEMCNLVRE